jgi:uncharacterized LabA/DUF88 family protein
MLGINAPAPQRPSSYLFIDGGCLSAVQNAYYDRYFPGLEPVFSWSEFKGFNRKAYYYDAIPVQTANEDDNAYGVRIAPKRQELARIERQPGYHVRTGDAIQRRRRGLEQKMVDVQLAVDCLSMASRGLFEKVTLVMGDLDFRPLVSALVEMGLDVTVLYPRGEASEFFLSAADRADPIVPRMMEGWIDREWLSHHPLPTAQYNFKNNSHNAPGALRSWNDDLHGHCAVFMIDGGQKVKLFSETSPLNSNTHQLEIVATSMEHLRLYAGDYFDVVVPD